MGSSKKLGGDSLGSSTNFTRMKASNLGRNEALVACNCGYEAKKLVSRTEANPGRLFYRCPNWKKGDDCKFFKWADSLDGGWSCEEANVHEEGQQHVEVDKLSLTMKKLGEMDEKTQKIMWMGALNLCLLVLLLILVLVLTILCCKILTLL